MKCTQNICNSNQNAKMPNCFFSQKEKRLQLGHLIVNFVLCWWGEWGGGRVYYKIIWCLSTELKM